MNGALVAAIACSIATDAHAGQVDKIGEPYIGHCARVAQGVADAGFGYEIRAAAWLHDVVEDTEYTLDDLRKVGITESVLVAVEALTKRPHEPFKNYYERVKANPMAVAVKWHDVADNAREDRLALVAPDTRERLRAKYERARHALTTVPPFTSLAGPRLRCWRSATTSTSRPPSTKRP